jgi:predicted dehydrogenase
MSETIENTPVNNQTESKLQIAPDLPYRPQDPKKYKPNIAIIGCGGISGHHLQAYKDNGYNVVAFHDRVSARAKARRDEYFPQGEVIDDLETLLGRTDIEVVDIATHPIDRVALIEKSLNAGKHVLSQKPFVLDLETGDRLVKLAAKNGVLLAVNQNGRWAPHLSYIREAVRAGLIGDVLGIHVRIHWDHSWIKGTAFESIEDIILYDFAIHWFDFVSTLLPGKNISRVFATKTKATGQDVDVPLLAQAIVEFDGGQASLIFDGNTRYGSNDTTYIAGTSGSIISTGPELNQQTVQLYTKDGVATPGLVGAWFDDGFHGTMAELLCAVEEGRTSSNNAHDNLRSLSLAFAAIVSANEKRPVNIGEVTALPTYEGTSH